MDVVVTKLHAEWAGPSGPSGVSGASGPSGSHAARADTKVSRPEQSAANAALKVVVAQAKADVVAEKRPPPTR